GRGESALGVARVENPRQFGVVELEGDRIARLVEKPEEPKSDLAIVGVYYLRESAALFSALAAVVESEMRTGGEIQLTDALQVMIERGDTMKAFEVDTWLDCGSPESLLATNRKLLEARGERPPKLEGSVLIPPVY